MAYNEKTLLQNHLAFLRSHRGTVREDSRTISVESDKAECTYTILGAQSAMSDIASTTQRLQILASCPISEKDLTDNGFTRIFGLSYMVFDAASRWRMNAELTVVEVKGQQEVMNEFSEVQARGFCENESDYQAWQPFLKAANDRNLKNSQQHFYVGYLNGEPVGTVLTVEENAIVGIYAVATLPEHRKKGISTTIMARAVQEARMQDVGAVTLQVNQDSYVEEFYRHLGFKRVFTAGVYRR